MGKHSCEEYLHGALYDWCGMTDMNGGNVRDEYEMVNEQKKMI